MLKEVTREAVKTVEDLLDHCRLLYLVQALNGTDRVF